MKNHALEIHVRPNTREVVCFICSPAFGEAPLLLKDPVQTLTLNDGLNRVRVGVSGQRLSLDTIKRIARESLSGSRSW
jgi:hypothetical protein